jgi:hypothetical protein
LLIACSAQAQESVPQNKLASQLDLEQRAFMLGGRLRIPCGKGFVTLPAMSGVGS